MASDKKIQKKEQQETKLPEPEQTAIRVALWRALHVQVDHEPHIFSDEVGLKLVGENNWRDRYDMGLEFSKNMRASIVGRARFIEDLVEEQVQQGITQYVILGAGLDTFAQRRSDIGKLLHIFEIDQPGTQAWKKQRLIETGWGIPAWLHFVSVDFEKGQSWWEKLMAAGFDIKKAAIVVSTGVSMYLSKEANLNLFQQISKMASTSIFLMTFMLSLDLMTHKERATMEFVMKKAQESGTPFLSLFSPLEILIMAREAGFRTSQYVSAHDLYQRYFINRSDNLNAGTAEGFLVATT